MAGNPVVTIPEQGGPDWTKLLGLFLGSTQNQSTSGGDITALQQMFQQLFQQGTPAGSEALIQDIFRRGTEAGLPQIAQAANQAGVRTANPTALLLQNDLNARLVGEAVRSLQGTQQLGNQAALGIAQNSGRTQTTKTPAAVSPMAGLGVALGGTLLNNLAKSKRGQQFFNDAGNKIFGGLEGFFGGNDMATAAELIPSSPTDIPFGDATGGGGIDAILSEASNYFDWGGTAVDLASEVAPSFGETFTSNLMEDEFAAADNFLGFFAEGGRVPGTGKQKGIANIGQRPDMGRLLTAEGLPRKATASSSAARPRQRYAPNGALLTAEQFDLQDQRRDMLDASDLGDRASNPALDRGSAEAGNKFLLKMLLGLATGGLGGLFSAGASGAAGLAISDGYETDITKALMQRMQNTGKAGEDMEMLNLGYVEDVKNALSEIYGAPVDAQTGVPRDLREIGFSNIDGRNFAAVEDRAWNAIDRGQVPEVREVREIPTQPPAPVEVRDFGGRFAHGGKVPGREPAMPGKDNKTIAVRGGEVVIPNDVVEYVEQALPGFWELLLNMHKQGRTGEDMENEMAQGEMSHGNSR